MNISVIIEESIDIWPKFFKDNSSIDFKNSWSGPPIPAIPFNLFITVLISESVPHESTHSDAFVNNSDAKILDMITDKTVTCPKSARDKERMAAKKFSKPGTISANLSVIDFALLLSFPLKPDIIPLIAPPTPEPIAIRISPNEFIVFISQSSSAPKNLVPNFWIPLNSNANPVYPRRSSPNIIIAFVINFEIPRSSVQKLELFASFLTANELPIRLIIKEIIARAAANFINAPPSVSIKLDT